MPERFNQHQLARRVAEHVEKLPPIPGNLDLILREATREPRDDTKLKNIIRNDPGLCSELLHQAACAVSDHQSAAETLDEAIEQAGLEYLVDLIGTSYLTETIQHEFRAMDRLDDYFRHSREIAATCPILAGLLGLPHHQRQFYEMAGILHDIGRLVIGLAANRHGLCLLGTNPSKMTSIAHDETMILGLNHCEVGKLVCRKWGFADRLTEGVQRHHTPLLEPQDFSYPGALLFLAHFVSGSDFTGEILFNLIPVELFDRLQLTPELFNQACRQYQDLVKSGN